MYRDTGEALLGWVHILASSRQSGYHGMPLWVSALGAGAFVMEKWARKGEEEGE